MCQICGFILTCFDVLCQFCQPNLLYFSAVQALLFYYKLLVNVRWCFSSRIAQYHLYRSQQTKVGWFLQLTDKPHIHILMRLTISCDLNRWMAWGAEGSNAIGSGERTHQTDVGLTTLSPPLKRNWRWFFFCRFFIHLFDFYINLLFFCISFECYNALHSWNIKSKLWFHWRE